MGITVKEDTYGGISDVKLMVKSGADKFDIFLVVLEAAHQGQRKEYLKSLTTQLSTLAITCLVCTVTIALVQTSFQLLPHGIRRLMVTMGLEHGLIFTT